MTVLDSSPVPSARLGKRRWWALGAMSLAVSRNATVLGAAFRPTLSRAPHASELNPAVAVPGVRPMLAQARAWLAG